MIQNLVLNDFASLNMEINMETYLGVHRETEIFGVPTRAHEPILAHSIYAIRGLVMAFYIVFNHIITY